MVSDGMRGRSLFVIAVAVALLLLAGRAAVALRDADQIDFRCFWEAGRLMREGRDPYDTATWASAVYTDPARVPHCALTFVYPGVTSLMLVPLSLVPEPVALALWEVLLVLCVVAAVTLIARAWPAGDGTRILLPLILWSQPMFSAVANGQFGPVLLLGFVALLFGLERARGSVAALAWLLLLIKPHLTAIVLAGTLFVRGARWRIAALAGAIVLLGASIAIAPAWPGEYIKEALEQRLVEDIGLSSLWTFAAGLGLSPLIGGLAAGALVAIGVALLPRHAPRPRDLVAILVAVTFVVVPYVRPPDMSALAVCWAAPLARSRVVGGRRWLYAVVVVALVMPWTVTILNQLGVSTTTYVFVSIATGALMVAALRDPRTPA